MRIYTATIQYIEEVACFPSRQLRALHTDGLAGLIRGFIIKPVGAWGLTPFPALRVVSVPVRHP